MKPSIVSILGLGALVWGGCALNPAGGQTSSLANVYRAAPRLPPQVRRVAVLPVTAATTDLATEDGRDTLEPVLYTELRKRAIADVVVVTREQLRNLTGEREWTTAEALPRDFFERLHKATGCDLVAFCHLTYFRAYPPLGVGWSMQLVDVQGRILWAVDEVFDAGHPAVAAAARGYYVGHFRGPSFCDPDSILLSPRQFGQYAAARALETTPSR